MENSSPHADDQSTLESEVLEKGREEEIFPIGVQTPPAASLRRPTSLLEYVFERNAVTHNPVKGVERPRAESTAVNLAPQRSKASKLLVVPDADTLNTKRGRSRLSTLLFHALRRE